MPDIAAVSPFDTIRRIDKSGREYWTARELMAHLGYARWSDVDTGIDRAITSITNAISVSAAHTNIEPILTKARVGFGDREIEDYRLTRYGAYVWAMNCDPRKPEIAAAQSYFAVRTREAEITQQKTAGDDLDVLEGIITRMRADRQRITVLEVGHAETAAKVSAIEGRHDWFTALGYAKLHDHPTNRPYLSKVGAKAARLMRAQGDRPEPRQDATFGTVNTYPTDVLEQAFAEVAR